MHQPSLPLRRVSEFPAVGSGSGATTQVANELYRVLVDAVRDYAIFVLDPAGHVLTWNAGAARIKGYAAQEIIGRHFSTFYPEADLEEGKPARALEIARATGRYEEEGWRLRKDGSRFWANVLITALRDDQENLIGFAKVTRDLTERRKAEQRAIEDARLVAEMETANRTKAEFLAMMSHELRTPLNAIAGYVDLLSLGVRGPVSDQQMEDLERIRRSQQHLLAIINDVLNFSRVEAGRVSYQIEPVAVGPIVEAVIAMLHPQANAKGLVVSSSACASMGDVLADAAKLQQILLNLLSNAVKFTSTGGTVKVTCTRDHQRVHIVVSDTGPGIPSSAHEAVFEPFVQLGRSLSSSHEGAGLGLAISRDLARAMGGDLTVESDEGMGATFTVSLPTP
jgi:PAS domain S-box-containing protein